MKPMVSMEILNYMPLLGVALTIVTGPCMYTCDLHVIEIVWQIVNSPNLKVANSKARYLWGFIRWYFLKSYCSMAFRAFLTFLDINITLKKLYLTKRKKKHISGDNDMPWQRNETTNSKNRPKENERKNWFIFSFSRLASAPSSIAVLFNVQTLPPPVA